MPIYEPVIEVKGLGIDPIVFLSSFPSVASPHSGRQNCGQYKRAGGDVDWTDDSGRS